MTKKDLIQTVTEKLLGINIKKPHIEIIIETTLEAFIETLAKEGRIEIRDFGVFTVKRTPARPGRNPKTNQETQVPARNIIQFKAGKYMKESVRKKKKPI